MRTKAFTLVEILIVIVIIGILATVVILPAYQGALNASQEKVCTANEQVLKTALDIYSMEHDVMPGSLSELPDSYTRRAYAKVMKEYNGYDRFMLKLAVEISSWDERGNAYAQNFMRLYLTKGDLKTMTCPTDTTPPPLGVSYCLNAGLAGKSASTYKNLSGNVVLIADCDNANGIFASGNDFSCRHGITLFDNGNGNAKVITRSGSVQSVTHTGSYNFGTTSANITISQ